MLKFLLSGFRQLSNNQKFLKNFLSPFTPYNGILLFHSVGVGKSCSAISIAERYYDVYQKKVLIVLSSNIKENFRKQIFDINKYDIETNTYDVITRFGYTQRKIPSSAIHQTRTDQQGKMIRIKRLEPYYVWDKKK